MGIAHVLGERKLENKFLMFRFGDSNDDDGTIR